MNLYTSLYVANTYDKDDNIISGPLMDDTTTNGSSVSHGDISDSEFYTSPSSRRVSSSSSPAGSVSMLKKSCNVYMVSLLAFIVTVTSMMYILNDTISDPWDKYSYKEDAKRACERVRDGQLLREPANAVSNVTFMAVGIYCWLTAIRDYLTNKKGVNEIFWGIQAHPIWSFALGCTTLYIGIGSFMLHASGGRDDNGRRMDFSGIYTVAICLTCFVFYNTINIIYMVQYGPCRIFDARLSTFFVALFVCTLPACWYYDTVLWIGDLYFMCFVFLIAVAAIVAVTVIGSIWMRRYLSNATNEWPYLILATICLCVSLTCFSLNFRNDECDFGGWSFLDPTSAFQMHGLWHGTMAFAIGSLFLYFRSYGNEESGKSLRGMIVYVTLQDGGGSVEKERDVDIEQPPPASVAPVDATDVGTNNSFTAVARGA